jgi:hypothetical protein
LKDLYMASGMTAKRFVERLFEHEEGVWRF